MQPITTDLSMELWRYLLLGLIGSLSVRLVLCAMRASEHGRSDFKKRFWIYFVGSGAQGKEINDRLQPFFLGWLELMVYPALLSMGRPEYVGAWIALKTVPQWKLWTRKRSSYNRFLIGNALIVIFAYFLKTTAY